MGGGIGGGEELIYIIKIYGLKKILRDALHDFKMLVKKLILYK